MLILVLATVTPRNPVFTVGVLSSIISPLFTYAHSYNRLNRLAVKPVWIEGVADLFKN